ncbi:MAG: LemA family protein [archaeon]
MLELIVGVVSAIVLFLIVVGVIFTYNFLVSLRARVDNAWSQIDVQLKRRVDLIPNLIETVKGYAKFEKSVLVQVTNARTSMMSATSAKEKADANNMLTGALKSLFAVAEAYPALKANENFISLQEELSSTENKIAYARQFYNDSVMSWNTAILQFPTNLIAGIVGMSKQKDYFGVSEAERAVVKADFSDLSK